MALQNYRERVIRPHVIWKVTNEQLSEFLLNLKNCVLKEELLPRTSLEKSDTQFEHKIVFENGATGFILKKDGDVYHIKLRGYDTKLKDEVPEDLAEITRKILDSQLYVGVIFDHEETGVYHERHQPSN